MLDRDPSLGQARARPNRAAHHAQSSRTSRGKWRLTFSSGARFSPAEQGLFAESDRDRFDDHASPIVAQGEIAGMPDGVVGVVRIYREDADTWFGGRLGVARSLPARRRGGHAP